MKIKKNWLASIFLVTGLLVTFYITFYIKSDIDKIAEAEFKNECNEISSKIIARLHAHAQFLRSGAAFFNVSDTVTRKQWQTFIEESRINLNLQGIQGTGFSLIIRGDRLEQHLQKIRSEGFPAYKVWPEGKRETYTSIISLEPFSGRNLRAFGYDMMSEPVRREAMERSRDMDIAALSGKVLLVQETATDVQAGSLMYVPVYRKGAATNTVEQRRAAIKGWVYSPYRMNDLMSGILENYELNGNEEFNMHIFDGSECSPQSILFHYHLPGEKENELSVNERFTLKIPVDFNGHQWTLEFKQNYRNKFSEYLGVWAVRFGGFIISILLFLLARSLIGTKYRAQKIAESLTVELKENERVLKESQKIAKLGSFSLDLTKSIWKSSEILDDIFGIDNNYIRSIEGWSAIIHPTYRKQLMDYLNNTVIGKKQPFNKEYKIIRINNAEERWVHGLGKLEFDSKNNSVRMIGTISDITERKRSEQLQNITYNISNAAISSHNLEELLIFIKDQLGTVIDTTNFYVALYDKESDTISLPLMVDQKDKFTSFPSAKTLTGYVIKTKKPLLATKEVIDELKLAGEIEITGTISKVWLGVPLKINNKVTGAIVVQNYEDEDVYDTTDLDVLQFASDQISISVERKKAEEDLKIFSENYKRLVNKSPIILYRCSKTRGRIYYSLIAQDILGYSIDHLYKNPFLWAESVHPNDRVIVNDAMDRFFKGEDFDIQYRLKNAKGEWIWLRDRSIGRLNENNEEIIEGIASDITTIKLAEQKLNKLNKKLEEKVRIRTAEFNKLSRATEFSPIIVILTDAEGIIEYVNTEFTNKTEYNVEDAIGKKLDFLKSDVHPESFYDELWFTILKGEKWNGEICNTKKSGEPFWLNVSISSILDDSGKISNFVCVQEDISEQKRILAKLQENTISLEKSRKAALSIMQDANILRKKAEQTLIELDSTKNGLQLILDSAAEGIFGLDNNGICTFCNIASLKLLRYKDENELIGKNIHEQIHSKYENGSHFPEEKCKMSITFKNGKKAHISDEVLWRSDGTSFHSEYWSYPKYENNKLAGAVVTFIDITERKKIEKELIKAKDKAEAATNAKSSFLSNMSHEIRTPMNAILGFSEILTNSITDPIQKDYIESIHSSGKLLLDLINDILDFSKIEAGKMELQIASANISLIINDLTRMFEVKTIQKGIKFIPNISLKSIKDILIDELKLKQVLINLINNAIKFTNTGFVKLIVKIVEKSNNHVNLFFAIEDTGIGIPKKDHKKVLEAFNQTEDIDSKKYKGTGLGLAISKKYIEKMGGKLELESTPNVGSQFSFTLKNIELTEAQAPKKEEHVIIPGNIQFKNSKILVIDDVQSNHDLLIGYLKTYDLELFHAYDGKQGIKSALKVIPDIIFLDIRMPVMGGYSAIKKIKNNDKLNKIPVIAITASSFKNEKEKVLAAGFNYYLIKPFQLIELISLLTNFLPYEQSNVDVAETIENVILTDLSIPELTLPGFAEEFNTQLIPIWNSVKERRTQKLVSDFSSIFKEFGEKYNSQNCAEFGTQLKMANDSFNAEKVLVLLELFKKFVSKIKTLNI